MGEIVQGAWPGSGTFEPESITPKKVFAGTARCLACQFEWFAEATEGHFNNLACPSCTLNRGAMTYPAKPAIGSRIWICTCGAEIFYIYTPKTIGRLIHPKPAKICTGCGTVTPLTQGPE